MSLSSPKMTAFPVFQAGRLPHRPFRGLLSVHSRYGLHTRQVPREPSPREASDALLPPRLLSLLPAGVTVAGWDSHPLGNRAFARHTEISRLEESVGTKNTSCDSQTTYRRRTTEPHSSTLGRSGGNRYDPACPLLASTGPTHT
jgi:hypothetical protein